MKEECIKIASLLATATAAIISKKTPLKCAIDINADTCKFQFEKRGDHKKERRVETEKEEGEGNNEKYDGKEAAVEERGGKERTRTSWDYTQLLMLLFELQRF